MKVLALNSSPRGDGESKTAIMLDSLVAGMREAGAEVEVVPLKKKKISAASEPPLNFTATLERLLMALNNKETPGYLKWIKVRHGDEVRLISIDEVCYFKAEDKYTVVKTLDGESLIKKSIRQLFEELDPDQFWRIHRGTLINVGQIAGLQRTFAGRFIVKLKDLPETLAVSRSYSHQFKQM